MKRKITSVEKNLLERLIFPCGALLFLILAWVFGAKDSWRLIFSVLS